MLMTQRTHPFPCRTRKLSFVVPKILGGRLPGKIGKRRHFSFFIVSFRYSSIAQSVEHAAVNRGVVGSSPTGGAKSSRDRIDMRSLFFLHDFITVGLNTVTIQNYIREQEKQDQIEDSLSK